MSPPRFGQQHKLRNLLAACPTFQSEMGITTGTDEEKKTAAKLKIHRFQALDNWHPGSRAIIRFTSHTIRDQGVGTWKDSSRMFLTIELERCLPDDTETGLEEAEDEILDTFGTIINEMLNLQGSEEDDPGLTYLRITEVRLMAYDIDAASEGNPSDPSDINVDQKCIWWMQWEVSTS